METVYNSALANVTANHMCLEELTGGCGGEERARGIALQAMQVRNWEDPQCSGAPRPWGQRHSEKLPEVLVVPREKTPMGAAA